MKTKSLFFLFILALILVLPAVSAQTKVIIEPIPSSIEAGSTITITINPGTEGIGPNIIIKNSTMTRPLGTMCDNESKCYNTKEFMFYIPTGWQGTYSVSYTEYIKDEFDNVVGHEGTTTDFFVYKPEEIDKEKIKAIMAAAAAVGEQEGKRYVKSKCSFAAKTNILETSSQNGFNLVHPCPNCPSNYDFENCDERRILDNGMEERRSSCVKRDTFGAVYETKYSGWESRLPEDWECGSPCPEGWKWTGECEGKDHYVFGLVGFMSSYPLTDFMIKSKPNVITEGLFENIFSGIGTALTGIGRGIGEAIGGFATAFNDIKRGCEEGWSDLMHGNILGFFGKIADGILEGVGSIGQGLLKGVGDILGGLVSGVEKCLGGDGHLGDELANKFDEIGNKWKETFDDVLIQGDERQKAKPICSSGTDYQNSLTGQGTRESFGYTECALTPLYAESPSCGGEGTDMAGEKIAEEVCYWELEKSGDYALLFNIGEEVRITSVGTFKLLSIDENGKAVVEGPSDKVTIEKTGVASPYDANNNHKCSILKSTATITKGNVDITGNYAVHCTSQNIDFRYIKIKLT